MRYNNNEDDELSMLIFYDNSHNEPNSELYKLDKIVQKLLVRWESIKSIAFILGMQEWEIIVYFRNSLIDYATYQSIKIEDLIDNWIKIENRWKRKFEKKWAESFEILGEWNRFWNYDWDRHKSMDYNNKIWFNKKTKKIEKLAENKKINIAWYNWENKEGIIKILEKWLRNISKIEEIMIKKVLRYWLAKWKSLVHIKESFDTTFIELMEKYEFTIYDFLKKSYLSIQELYNNWWDSLSVPEDIYIALPGEELQDRAEFEIYDSDNNYGSEYEDHNNETIDSNLLTLQECIKGKTKVIFKISRAQELHQIYDSITIFTINDKETYAIIQDDSGPMNLLQLRDWISKRLDLLINENIKIIKHIWNIEDDFVVLDWVTEKLYISNGEFWRTFMINYYSVNREWENYIKLWKIYTRIYELLISQVPSISTFRWFLLK